MKLSHIATNAVCLVMYMLTVLMMPAIFYLSNVKSAGKNMKAAVLKNARNLFIFLANNKSYCARALIKDKTFSIRPKHEKREYLRIANSFIFQTRLKVLRDQYCHR